MTRCTAKVKDGADPLVQMRAAQPMRAGARLYAWMCKQPVSGSVSTRALLDGPSRARRWSTRWMSSRRRC